MIEIRATRLPVVLRLGGDRPRAIAAVELRLRAVAILDAQEYAPPLARAEHGKAGWWTRICEYVFGW